MGEKEITNIYFIRHCEPDYTNHDDKIRPLTKKGLQDSLLVTKFLADKNIDTALLSPYKRAVDTIKDFSNSQNLTIELIKDFRERKISDEWIKDFDSYSAKQWEDFTYKLSDGESLMEAQSRNIAALQKVITEHEGKNIIIGSHGAALSTIIAYYDKSFNYDNFSEMKGLMPWIVHFTFDKENCINIETFDILKLEKEE